MRTTVKKVTISTKEFYDIIDLTDKVEDFLGKIGADSGLINVFTRHTTVAIKINEREDGFFRDLRSILFGDLVSPEREYHHNDLETRDPATICPVGGHECLNGHSHVAQMFIGSASETVPVEDGKLLLGRWQRILMFELDGARDREVVFTFSGKCNS